MSALSTNCAHKVLHTDILDVDVFPSLGSFNQYKCWRSLVYPSNNLHCQTVQTGDLWVGFGSVLQLLTVGSHILHYIMASYNVCNVAYYVDHRVLHITLP